MLGTAAVAVVIYRPAPRDQPRVGLAVGKVAVIGALRGSSFNPYDFGVESLGGIGGGSSGSQ